MCGHFDEAVKDPQAQRFLALIWLVFIEVFVFHQ
jgi:hypothetical protein